MNVAPRPKWLNFSTFIVIPCGSRELSVPSKWWLGVWNSIESYEARSDHNMILLFLLMASVRGWWAFAQAQTGCHPSYQQGEQCEHDMWCCCSGTIGHHQRIYTSILDRKLYKGQHWLCNEDSTRFEETWSEQHCIQFIFEVHGLFATGPCLLCSCGPSSNTFLLHTSTHSLLSPVYHCCFSSSKERVQHSQHMTPTNHDPMIWTMKGCRLRV